MRETAAPASVRRGIQTRLAVLVLVAALAPMLLLGWSSYSSLSAMRDALLAERLALASSAARQVEREVRGMLEALAAVSPSQPDSLRVARLRSRLLSGVMLVDASGAPLQELSSCTDLPRAIRLGAPVVCGAGARRFVVVPLRDTAGRPNSAAVGVLDLRDPSWAALLPPKLELRDEHGGLLAGSDAPYDTAACERLTVLPWTVAAAEPESEAKAALKSLERRWLVLAPGLAAFAAVFAWGVSRSVKAPLAKLEKAASRIAAGDLTQPLPVLGSDEIGRLGRSFETMRVALAKDVTRRRLLRKVITAQEEERKRIARELHDETCQTITALKMKLDAAGMEDAQAMAMRSLDELHRIIYDLRPSILDDLGLLPAIRWLAMRGLPPSGVEVRCEFDELPAKLPFEVEIAVFRAVQEAINNIVRHAHAETVLIEVAAAGDTLAIDIEDDGDGFDVASVGAPARSGRGLGILGMREHMELIGGAADVVSSTGKGTRVSLRVPLAAAER